MSFTEFNLHHDLIQAIEKLGYKEPTPVQQHTIPEALQGYDVRACAQTGSGKTIAFMLPALNKLLSQPLQPRPTVLIVVPTRELAEQVTRVATEAGHFTKIKSACIVGGANMNRQITELRSGVQIVAATPGRLLDHMERRNINLKTINTVILDEADRMLDMGFLPDIRRILAACPTERQTMLFSATFPPEIQALTNTFLKNPKIITLSPSAPSDNVTQLVYPVSRSQKEALLQAVIESCGLSSALVFCRTKQGADQLVGFLKKIGKSVAVIHSNRTQAERNQALDGFRARQIQILVATDIASRGIDVKDISHVINYDVPMHPEDYVHRIGRTGRAQATGDAFTLVSPDEESYLKRIEKFISKTLPRGVIPNFPYLAPPRLTSKGNPWSDSFGRGRRKIASSRAGRFR